MISHEIVYERNMNGSYMKLPISAESKFDEKLMLRKKLPGLLPVECCYLNGTGQYWYNISGKQSLDSYCRIEKLKPEFMERLVISICSELDILEWNLIDANCLVMDPELIFVSNSTREIIFMIYPDNRSPIREEFRKLMEYLISRINHSDPEAVRFAYQIYEKAMEEGYYIADLREDILKHRGKTTEAVTKLPQTEKGWDLQQDMQQEPQQDRQHNLQRNRHQELQRNRLRDWEQEPAMKEAKQIIRRNEEKNNRERSLGDWQGFFIQKINNLKGKWKKEPKHEQREIFHEKFPCERLSEETTCLSFSDSGISQLVCEGNAQLPEISIENPVTLIGKSKNADGYIPVETVSRNHARIEKLENAYYIEDLNSTNGTYVNEQLLSYKEKKKLNRNDKIRFADVSYRVL